MFFLLPQLLRFVSGCLLVARSYHPHLFTAGPRSYRVITDLT